MKVRGWRPTTVECPNERHRAPLASRRAGDRVHADIERGKLGPDRIGGEIVATYDGDSRQLDPSSLLSPSYVATISPPIWSGPVLPSPALCPCEPRRPGSVKQAVPYGTRLDTRPLSASSSEPPSLRSALSGNIIIDLMSILKPERHLHLPAMSGYPAAKRNICSVFLRLSRF